jgi:hypothetical protein
VAATYLYILSFAVTRAYTLSLLHCMCQAVLWVGIFRHMCKCLASAWGPSSLSLAVAVFCWCLEVE